MVHMKLDTREGLPQGYLFLHQEVATLALQELMLAGFYNKNDIAGLEARCCIALAIKYYLVTRFHSLFNVHFKHVLACFCFLSKTRFALVFWLYPFSNAAAENEKRKPDVKEN